MRDAKKVQVMQGDLRLALSGRAEVAHVRCAPHHDDIEHTEGKGRRVVLRDVGDLSREFPLPIRTALLPVEEHAPCAAMLAHNTFQQGALARAVLSENAVNPRAREGECHVLQDCAPRIVGKAQLLYVQSHQRTFFRRMK